MSNFNRFIRVFTLVALSSVLGIFGMNFYENYSYSKNLNLFLEDASVVSNLHKESSQEFGTLLNFDEIGFESCDSNRCVKI